MTAHVLRADVEGYVAAVRRELQDLSTDELEELIGGLGADLSDLAAESEEPLERRLGDPTAYAAELREAAGLPRRPRPGRTPLGRTVRERLRADEAALRARLDREPWWPAVSEFLLVLRPAWWVLRAYVAVQLLGLVLGSYPRGILPNVLGHLSGTLLLFVATVISVELGRGRWRSPRRDDAVAVGNAVAVLGLVVVLATSPAGTTESVVYTEAGYPQGLAVDGQVPLNIFPYDAQGRPLADVQLFDEGGRPLDISPEARERWQDDGTVTVQLPAVVAGSDQWNVYPLKERRTTDPYAEPGPGDLPSASELPLVAVPPVAAQPTPAPSGSPAKTPTADAASPSMGTTGTSAPTESDAPPQAPSAPAASASAPNPDSPSAPPPDSPPAAAPAPAP